MSHTDSETPAPIEKPSSTASRSEESQLEALPVDITDFIKETEAHLARLQADFLSESTRKEQRLLLISAFVLLFVSLGSITVVGSQIEPGAGVKISAANTDNIRKLGALIVGYLEITFLIRVFTDSASHSIAKGLAELTIALRRPLEPRSLGHREGDPGGWRHKGDIGWYSGEELPADVAAHEAKMRQYSLQLASYSAKREWLHRHILRGKASNLLRLGLDVLFPLSLGAYAVYHAASTTTLRVGG